MSLPFSTIGTPAPVKQQTNNQKKNHPSHSQKHHESPHKMSHNKLSQDAKKAWEKISSQTGQALDGKNNQDAVFYPLHQARDLVEKEAGNEAKES